MHLHLKFFFGEGERSASRVLHGGACHVKSSKIGNGQL